MEMSRCLAVTSPRHVPAFGRLPTTGRCLGLFLSIVRSLSGAWIDSPVRKYLVVELKRMCALRIAHAPMAGFRERRRTHHASPSSPPRRLSSMSMVPSYETHLE